MLKGAYEVFGRICETFDKYHEILVEWWPVLGYCIKVGESFDVQASNLRFLGLKLKVGSNQISRLSSFLIEKSNKCNRCKYIPFASSNLRKHILVFKQSRWCESIQAFLMRSPTNVIGANIFFHIKQSEAAHCYSSNPADIMMEEHPGFPNEKSNQ